MTLKIIDGDLAGREFTILPIEDFTKKLFNQLSQPETKIGLYNTEPPPGRSLMLMVYDNDMDIFSTEMLFNHLLSGNSGFTIKIIGAWIGSFTEHFDDTQNVYLNIRYGEQIQQYTDNLAEITKNMPKPTQRLPKEIVRQWRPRRKQ